MLAEQIYAFWDEVADFDAARSDEALNHLLAFLCSLICAQNASWIGAVRMGDIQAGDPVHGWRPRAIHYLHSSRPLETKAQEQVDKLERGSVDITTIRNVSLAGTFRCNRLIDLVPESWFDSDYYDLYYREAGYEDAIWAGFPVNEDAETYFGIFRERGLARFSATDRDAVAFTLRGLKWFHRQQMLASGLLVANAPLTPAERKVLRGLLTGKPEKQIATELGKNYHTTHEYVSSIFRKFGVNNRATLMALWLGKAD